MKHDHHVLTMIILLAAAPSSGAQTEYTADGTPTALEEEIRWLTNRARFDTAAENTLRGTAYTDVPATAGPLAVHQSITTAARHHSTDMATLNVVPLQHATIPGSAFYNPVTQPKPWDRMTAEGYSNTVAGENITAGYSVAGTLTAEEAHLNWWNSTGHRVSLAKDDRREIGLGYAFNLAAYYRNYYTMNLGASGTNHFFTGTLFHDSNSNGKYDLTEGRGSLKVTLRVNGVPYTHFDIATAVGSFAVPLNSIATGANVEVSVQNLAATAVQVSIPRDFHNHPTVSLQASQTRVIGTFTKAAGTGNVGFRNLNLAPTSTPMFSPAAGQYAAGQTITITGDSGATIYYRVNGGAEQSAVSPVTGLTVPAAPATLSLSAYAKKSGMADSGVATANYSLLSAYQTWAGTWFPGVTNPLIVGPEADPDQDGQVNFVEFALGGNPNNAANNARIHSRIADSDDPDTAQELLLTIAVRTGTPAFTGTPSPGATKDGFTYTVQGSPDLVDFSTLVLKVAPVITGLPAAPTGYEYRSFSLDRSNNLPAKGFLRVRITPAP